MSLYFIDLEPVNWRSAIGGTDDRGTYQVIQVRTSFTGRRSRLYLKGLPESPNDPVELAIFREAYSPEELPLLGKSLEEPIQAVMQPSKGGSLPFGVISYIPNGPWFDARLYPGFEVFDDLWIRLRQNGSLPSLITLTIHGVQYGGQDDVIWDIETYPSRGFQFEVSGSTQVLVRLTNASPSQVLQHPSTPSPTRP